MSNSSNINNQDERKAKLIELTTNTERLAQVLRETDLDGMIEAFHRIIEANAAKQSPFHNPVNADAMMALRVLRGLAPGLRALSQHSAEQRGSLSNLMDRLGGWPVPEVSGGQAEQQEGPVGELVIDLRVEAYDALAKAASESNWIPPEYYANDWIADCCEFLRNGHPALSQERNKVDAERQEFEVYASERGFSLERYPEPGSVYVSFETDKHWQTWRAARAAGKENYGK